MNGRSLLAVAAALLVAASGCAAIPNLHDRAGQPPDSADVADSLESLEGIEATQVSSLNGSDVDSFTRTRLRISFDRDSERVRQFSRVVAPESDAGDVTYSDGNETLVYDASDNEVTRIPRSLQAGSRGTTAADRGEYYASVVAAARNDSTFSPPPGGGVSPLPVVPQGSSSTGAAAVASVDESAIEGYEVTYLGTDTLADRTAHGFQLNAVSDAALEVNRTLWLDSEYYYPLRVEQTVDLGDDEEPVHVSTHLENVTFNPEFGSEAFAWEPPADATTETLSLDSETYDSRDELVAAAPLPVPEPDVPEGYSFASGQVIDGNFTQVSAEYRHAETSGTLTVSAAQVDNESGDGFDAGESVTVAGQDAQYVVTERTSMVTWRCGDVQYSVMAAALDREDLLAVAASVGCE